MNAPGLAPLRSKLGLYLDLIRWNRPAGWLLLLWPSLAALWIAAGGFPGWHLVVVFVLGTVLMRSAGCCVNDVADREFDKHVKRTAQRPVTTGAVGVREALVLGAVLALLLILPLNGLTLALSLVAAFVAASYPFTKRFFALPQAYLGIAFGFGIPMAFAAIEGRVPAVGWVLLAANVAWAIAYDTEYAMVDRDDDLRIGIRTAAITFGRYDVIAVMVCYAITLGLLLVAGTMAALGWAWVAGLVVAACIAGYHYTLIRARSRDGCFKAFRHNNWFGAAVFAGLVVDRLMSA